MESDIWENYLNRESIACSYLTNREWRRFVEKDSRVAMDMAIRLTTRNLMLETGWYKRIPRHRKQKNPQHP